MLDKIYKLEEIAHLYELFIFDIWGVVLIEGEKNYKLIDFINSNLIEKLQKKVFFLSNTSRTSQACASALMSWGINTSPENVVTAGDITAQFINQIPNPIIYHLNEGREDASLMSAISQCALTKNLEEANLLLLTLYQDHHQDLNRFDELFKKSVALKLINVCSNSDIISPGANGVLGYNAGYFAKKIESFGGAVQYFGKPHIGIYRFLFDRIEQAKSKCLMIGDTLETDILGANRFGIDAALVTSGNSSRLYEKNANDVLKTQAINHATVQTSIFPQMILDIT